MSRFVEPELESRWLALKKRISQAAISVGRSFDEVKVVAVTKGQPIEKIKAAMDLGISEFGENYVQEWRAKMDVIDREISDLRDSRRPNKVAASLHHWHFIGHLQTNKVRSVVGVAEWIHTLDSVRLANAIERIAAERGQQVKVLIEVNLALEASKTGLAPEQLDELINHCLGLKHLSLWGMMTMPPADTNKPSFYFARLREMLVARVSRVRSPRHPWTELSMGTSGDFEAAIQEGATMVRLGRVLFGERTGGKAL